MDQNLPLAPAKEVQDSRILLVEDDAFISQMYAIKFKQAGHNLLTAMDGEEGLSMAKEEKPDAILLDLVLPKIEGFDVLEELKRDEITKHIPVILLTNLGQEANVQRGMSMGAADYIVKAHYTPQQVVERVEKILGELKRS